MAKKSRYQAIRPDDPLYHADHARPVSRRDFIRQGMLGGTGLALGSGIFSMFADPRAAYGAVSSDLKALADDIGCSVGDIDPLTQKIPFICFDLAGGANFAGSSVLVGTQGQRDTLSTAGYNKLGLPGDMIPGLSSAGVNTLNGSTNNDFINDELGLLFHSDSPLLRGILEKFSAPGPGGIDGCVIPARSDNDTGNNPHNPLYAIAAAGAKGGVVDLIGSRSSVSGGNSMSPAMFINNEIRPTKVDRPSDVTGMVDVGDLTGILSDPEDVTAVMESMARITHKKMGLNESLTGNTIPTGQAAQVAVLKDLIRCGYIKSADIAERFAGRDVSPDDRLSDQVIVGPTSDPNNPASGSIFSTTEFDNDGEFRKTASVMRMVLDGHAGAGCITMGGYDYHTGNRFVGENRDLRAGRCIGAVLEYARRKSLANPTNPTPVMIYVFSDGSLTSNGNIDDSLPQGGNELGGRGKGQWTGDNSSVACSFFLVYDPNNGLTARKAGDHRQIGWFDAGANVVTSSHRGANNVNLLVNTVLLNFMALNGDEAGFASLFPNGNHGLGTLDNLMAFNPIA
jgi:hypothetical protein